MGIPLINTRPFIGLTKPIIALNKVDFPEPFIPTKPLIEPRFSFKLASCKATLPL